MRPKDYKSFGPPGRIYLYPGGGRSKGGCPFTQGTFWDLEDQGIAPKPGMRLDFYTDDGNDKGELDCLLFSGVINCDPETGEWYAVIDQGSFFHQSDLSADSSN
jgi:hypothetical protein